MRLVEKYPIERMKDKGLKLSFQCPYCKSSRIEMSRPEDMNFWRGVKCAKCKTLVVLDSLSVLAIRENMTREVEQTAP